MKLNIKLNEEKKSEDRVRNAKQKKADANYSPTLQEVFIDGWITKTGKRKVAIKDRKNSETDIKKIDEVYSALQNNVLGLDGINTKDISKATVINVLYPRLVEIKKGEMLQHLKDTAPKNYYCVLDDVDLEYMVHVLEQEEAFALDTETTGVAHDDVIVGYSITCPKADKHFYVPFRHTDKDTLTPYYAMEAIRPFLENPNVLKVLANAKFDHEKFFYDEYSIYFVNFVDVQVLMYVLNENEPSYKLKDLATKYGKQFGFPDPSDTYETLFGKGGFEDTPLDVAYIYACKDTHITWNMYQWQLEHLRKQPKLWHVAFDIEMPLMPVILKMQYRGFGVDQQYAENYRKELEEQIKEMEGELSSEYFPNINLNSNQQLSNYLYNVLELPNTHNGAVDKDALKDLAEEYEGVEVLLKYRKLTKLLSTYIEPLPKMVWEDGFLHGEINQRGTKTGRLASQNPNLQNIPPDARKILVAPEGKMYMSCDFSKMEIFIACELSGDPNLYEALHSGADVYSVLASKSYNLPIEECGDGTIYRKHSKTALLGCMYGALPFTIAKQVDVSIEEGKKILDDFFNGNPVLTAQIHKCHEQVATQGYVETLNGRKRRFPEIPNKVKLLEKLDRQIKQKTGKTGTQWDKEFDGIYKAKKVPYELRKQWYALNKEIQKAFRQSFNATDQGTGGDICKIALINLDKYFTELNKDLPPEQHYHLISTIHDEQLIELPVNVSREIIEQIEYIMCNTMPLKVKMKCDIEFYKTYYYDGKSVEQVLAGDLPKKLEV